MKTHKVDFDEYVTNYNSLLRKDTQFFSNDDAYFAKYKVSIAESRLEQKPKRVLEFGCGIGRNIPFLQAAFPDAVVAGSDISASSLQFARDFIPDAEFYLDGDDSPGRLPYDLVFVAGVFHHISPTERLSVLRRIRSKMSGKGNLFVFEHNPWNPVTRKIVDRCPFDADAVLIRKPDLTALINQSGLRVSASGYCLFFPPKLMALPALEGALSWLPLGGQYWIRAERND